MEIKFSKLEKRVREKKMTVTKGIICSVHGSIPGDYDQCPLCQQAVAPPPPPPPVAVGTCSRHAEFGTRAPINMAEDILRQANILRQEAVRDFGRRCGRCGVANPSHIVDGVHWVCAECGQDQLQCATEGHRTQRPCEPKPKVKAAAAAPVNNWTCCRILYTLLMVYVITTLACCAIGVFSVAKSPSSSKHEKMETIYYCGAPGMPRCGGGDVDSPETPLETPLVYANCVILPKPDVAYGPFTLRAGRLTFAYHTNGRLNVSEGDKELWYTTSTTTGLMRKENGVWNVAVERRAGNALCVGLPSTALYPDVKQIALPLVFPAPLSIRNGTCVLLTEVGLSYGRFELRSARNSYYAAFQDDNNLVVYGNERMSRAIGSSYTHGDMFRGIMRSSGGRWLIGDREGKLPDWGNSICLNDEGKLETISIDPKTHEPLRAIAIGGGGESYSGISIAIGHRPAVVPLEVPTVHGNCVILPEAEKPYGTFEVRAGDTRLAYQGDNNLVLYNEANVAQWSSDTATRYSTATGLKRSGWQWRIGSHPISVGSGNALCIHPGRTKMTLEQIDFPVKTIPPTLVMDGSCVWLPLVSTLYGPFELRSQKGGHYAAFTHHSKKLMVYSDATAKHMMWSSSAATGELIGITRNNYHSWTLGKEPLTLPYTGHAIPRHNALCLADSGLLEYAQIDPTTRQKVVGTGTVPVPVPVAIERHTCIAFEDQKPIRAFHLYSPKGAYDATFRGGERVSVNKVDPQHQIYVWKSSRAYKELLASGNTMQYKLKSGVGITEYHKGIIKQLCLTDEGELMLMIPGLGRERFHTWSEDEDRGEL